jgi:hypothetical protein
VAGPRPFQELTMTIDPRIAEILRQRREQGVVIEQTLQVPRKSTGATPSWVPSGTFGTTPLQVPALDTTTEITPLDDSELAKRLAIILPATDTLIRNAIAALKSDGKLTWLEALTFVPDIRNIVSEVVGKLVPEIKGTSARELVILVLAQLLQQYLSPYLPAPLRGWLTAQILCTLVAGLQSAYEIWVKPRLKTKSSAVVPSR